MRLIKALLTLTLILAGCQTVLNTSRNVTGLYTVSLGNSPSRDKLFSAPADELYDATIAALKDWKVYVPIQNRKTKKIVATGFARATDTTEVGIFFIALAPEQTKVYLASKNPNLLDRTAAALFARLEKEPAGIPGSN